jgi:hypothetical protein
MSTEFLRSYTPGRFLTPLRFKVDILRLLWSAGSLEERRASEELFFFPSVSHCLSVSLFQGSRGALEQGSGLALWEKRFISAMRVKWCDAHPSDNLGEG